MTFSKIGDLLTVKPASPDGGRKEQQKGSLPRQKRGSGATEGTARSEDAVILSASALRAMIAAENPADAKDILARLARLESHGLASLPLLPGQTAAEAVTEAASFLSSAR